MWVSSSYFWIKSGGIHSNLGTAKSAWKLLLCNRVNLKHLIFIISRFWILVHVYAHASLSEQMTGLMQVICSLGLRPDESCWVSEEGVQL
jgi:hypothetical protein